MWDRYFRHILSNIWLVKISTCHDRLPYQMSGARAPGEYPREQSKGLILEVDYLWVQTFPYYHYRQWQEI